MDHADKYARDNRLGLSAIRCIRGGLRLPAPVDCRARLRWLLTQTLLAVLCVSVHAQNVVILSSDTLTSTRRAISGAKSVISKHGDTYQFVKVELGTESGDDNQPREKIVQANPKLILTIGSAATQYAKEQFPDIPTVFSSVLYPTVSGFVNSLETPGGLITGASLDIPADIQFRYFREIVPDLKTLGVLYTANTAALIEESKTVAHEMGLKLVAIEISDVRLLAKALDSLSGLVDGLWTVADPNLFNPQSTRYILLQALKRNLPLMGFSRHVVESGALFAIDFDYKAIGRQAGAIACAVLDGHSPSTIPVSVPDIPWFHYNAKTAERLGVVIPDELVAVAKEVYR